MPHNIRYKLLWSTLFSIGITTTVAFGLCFQVFSDLENKTFDWRAGIFRKNSVGSSSVSLLFIDEHSLQVLSPAFGRWPWPRSVYEQVLSFLSMGGAKAVIFDILFTESETGRAENSVISRPNSSDQALVDATRQSGNVFHSFQILEDTEDGLGRGFLGFPLPDRFVSKFSLKNVSGALFSGPQNNMFYLPFPELYEASYGMGLVTFLPDRDGVYRRTRLIRGYQGNYFPALSIAPLLSENSRVSVSSSQRSLKLSGNAKSIDIPVGRNGSYLINPVDRFNTFSISGIFESAQKIYQGEMKNLPVSPEEFKDKIVFIGASATGVEDLKSTPLGSQRPGVELHASIVSNILKDNFLKVVDDFTTLLLTAFLSSSICFLVVFLPTHFSKIAVPASLFFILFFYWIVQFKEGVVFSLISPLAGALGAWVLSFAYLSFTEGRDRLLVKRMFSRYISPALINELLKDTSVSLKASAGTSERLSILFADIRGFTSISEGLPAKDVVWILNRYLPEMVEVIFEHKGTVDKFIGDAIMAFWGAPVRDENHALNSVNTAVEMFRRLEGLNLGPFKEKGLPEVRIGIGIHTGTVVLGNIGSEKKLDYTVIGDNVNIASRLEGLTKTYGISVLITEETFMELEGRVPCRIIDLVRVKGRQNPVRIYGLLCTSFDSPEILKEKEMLSARFEEAFACYFNQDWENALLKYTSLKRSIPKDKYILIMIERCQEFLRSGCEDWDGVYKVAGN